MLHGRNIAVVVVALCLVSMSFLSTHVTFQGNTGTVPALQMRIEELERELASRLKCPHAAPVDQISSGRKPSDCDDHSAVITQLEAQVETLRQSLLNECSNGRALWVASLEGSGGQGAPGIPASDTPAFDQAPSQLPLPTSKVAPTESTSTEVGTAAVVSEQSALGEGVAVSRNPSDAGSLEILKDSTSEIPSTSALDRRARLGSEYAHSSSTSALSDVTTFDASPHKPVEVSGEADHSDPRPPTVRTPPTTDTAADNSLTSLPMQVPSPISMAIRPRGDGESGDSPSANVKSGIKDSIKEFIGGKVGNENEQTEGEDAFAATDDDHVALPTQEVLSSYNVELLHRFASSAADIGGEGKNGTPSLMPLSGHRSGGAQNDTAQRYADAVGEIGLRLTAAEAARSRAETEAALLAETSARLLGQAIEARENLVEARREAKQWETKALEALHLAARLATQHSSEGKEHQQHASVGSSSNGARGLTNSNSPSMDGQKTESSHENTVSSSIVLGSPSLGMGRAARHLYLSRAHVAESYTWRNLGLDAVPANRTAKFKAPCWYPNQHLSQRHGSSSSIGTTTSTSSSNGVIARPPILGHSRRLLAIQPPPSTGAVASVSSAAATVAAVGKGLKCLPYFYVAGPTLRSVALLRLLEHHPEVVPTEPASSGDSMVYPLWWLHSTTSSPSSGALNNVSSANSATSHALLRFSNASKAVQRAYNLGGRQRFFGEAVPSMLTRLVMSHAPPTSSPKSDGVSPHNRANMSPLRPLLPELLHAAQGDSRLKVVAILRDPSWVAASALLDAILSAHTATLAPGTGFYLPRDLSERLTEGAKQQLAAFDACVGAPAATVNKIAEAGAGPSASTATKSTLATGDLAGKVAPGGGGLHVGMPVDWPRTDWRAEPSEVLRCAFRGSDAKSRDVLSTASREGGTNKGSTNGKPKGALLPKEEELLDGGWPGGGLYARAAELWWAGSPRTLLLLHEDDVASLLAFFESDPASKSTSSGPATESSKEVLKKLLTHLDLSKTAMPTLLAAAGLQQEATSQAGSDTITTSSSSHPSSKSSDTAPSTTTSASRSPATTAAVAAAVLKKKRRSAILREHGAACLGLYRRWFAPHNRELASLTGDACYLEWNNKDHHLRDVNSRGQSK